MSDAPKDWTDGPIPTVKLQDGFVRLTPEQIEEKSAVLIKLMLGTKALMDNIHTDDLELITKRAEEIEPNLWKFN